MLTNIVMMGMGEPLYNFDNVRDAMAVVMDGEGLSLSRRRITLSTSGVVPEIARTATEIGCQLAVSFHATTDPVRDRLVPINRRWNIEQLLGALRDYPRLSNSERITFEYVMLDGVNDSDEDARRLIRLIRGIPAKINLIPFNEWPGAPYRRSSWDRIEAFADIIYKAGYASPIRTPRGEDIMAACGQLKSATERGRKSARDVAAEALGQVLVAHGVAAVLHHDGGAGVTPHERQGLRQDAGLLGRFLSLRGREGHGGVSAGRRRG